MQKYCFFVSDIIRGIVLGLFGPLHLALGQKEQGFPTWGTFAYPKGYI